MTPEQRDWQPDWLDVALKNHPVADDGFYDRVIAVGRAQRRNRWLLRAVVAVLAAGFAAALGSLVVYQAYSARGRPDAAAHERWLDGERAAFRRELARLDALPALARRSGRDAAPVLDPVERALRADADDPTHCGRALAAVQVSRDARLDVDADCDTSFIVGLAGYDEWRRVRDVVEDPPRGDWRFIERDFAALARSHLRKARKQGGAAYAAAGADVAALGRLLFGHTPWAGSVFHWLAEETREAEAAGESGGFVAPLTPRDANIATHLWLAAVGFAGVAADDEDFAVVDGSRSVLSCGARSDASADLVLQEAFFADARSARLAPAGCAPRVGGAGTWLLFDERPTTSARLRAALLDLPLVRRAAAAIVTPLGGLPSIVDAAPAREAP